MDLSEALRIVRSLADGIDPHTQQKLPSVCHHPDTIRALFLAVGALEKVKRNEERRASLPEKAGVAWSQHEEARLVASFDSGSQPSELAKLHGRTEWAIRSRLIKLGKLLPDSWR